MRTITLFLLALLLGSPAAHAATITYDLLNESQADASVFSAFQRGDAASVVKPTTIASVGQILTQSKLGDWVSAIKRSPGRQAFQCELKATRSLSRTPKIQQSSVTNVARSNIAERTLYAASYNAYLFSTKADSGGQRVVSLLFARENETPMGCEEAFPRTR